VQATMTRCGWDSWAMVLECPQIVREILKMSVDDADVSFQIQTRYLQCGHQWDKLRALRLILASIPRLRAVYSFAVDVQPFSCGRATYR
jgi:hypothetical protein